MERQLLKKLQHYVPLLNAEIGQTEKNAFTIKYMMQFEKVLKTYEFENCYIAYIILPDYWNTKYISVVSLYVSPEKRNNPKYLKHLLSYIMQIAKEENCKYLVMGSHWPNAKKFSKLLSGLGFVQFLLRKDL